MTYGELIKIVEKAYQGQYVRGGYDFGDFIGFFMCPKSIPKNEDYESGPYMVAIDKKTRRVFDYNLLDNPKLFQKATLIKL